MYQRSSLPDCFQVARAPLVICDPSYVAGSPKVRRVGHAREQAREHAREHARARGRRACLWTFSVKNSDNFA